MVTSRDAFANILSPVSLDIYIKDEIEKFKPQKQIGGTFYAHAATALLHLAMHRIIGCAGKPSYPTFEDPKNEMLKKYGTCGKNIEEVVKQVCFK